MNLPLACVLDASVTLKWVLSFDNSSDEGDLEQAFALLDALKRGDLDVVQPSHWLAEMAGVLCRLVPSQSESTVAAIAALELPEDNSYATLRRAVQLATGLSHHIFDTLYHAVALDDDRMLITADVKYFRKARHLGNIALLKNLDAGISLHR